MNNWDKFVNSVTVFLTSSAELLGTKQPQRVSIGIVLGLAIDFVLRLLADEVGYNIDFIKFYHPIAVGIIIVYLPLILNFSNPARKEVYDERLDRVFSALKKTFDDGHVDLVTRRQFYIQVAQKLVDSLNLDEATRAELEAFRRMEEIESEGIEIESDAAAE